jgi:hypothetical protein
MQNIFTRNKIIVLILILSIAANGYFFGTRYIDDLRANAFNRGVISVFLSAEQTGKIYFTFPEGTNRAGQQIRLIIERIIEQ